VICRAQRPGQPIGEITWNDFYYNLLLKVRKHNLTLIWLGLRKQFQISDIYWKYQDKQKHFCIFFCIRAYSWVLMFTLLFTLFIKIFSLLSYFIQGEVQEIVIHSGVNRATAILHPGAVYKGQTLPTQVGKEQQPSHTQGVYTRARLFPHR